MFQLKVPVLVKTKQKYLVVSYSQMMKKKTTLTGFYNLQK